MTCHSIPKLLCVLLITLVNVRFTTGQPQPQLAKKEEAFQRHSTYVSSVAFSPDGRLLATAGRDRSLKIWDTQTFQLVRLASEFMISYEEMETITDNAIS